MASVLADPGCSFADDATEAQIFSAYLSHAHGLGGPDSPAVTQGTAATAPDDLLATLAEAAVANGCTADTASGRDRIAMRVMGLLMPKPSEIEATFKGLLAQSGPKAATNWFYRTCCDAGYVRRTAIARNVCWNTQTDWGSLEITINLSKPEKDPREIAAAGKAPAGEKYPACQLCIENEGYPGRAATDPMGAHPQAFGMYRLLLLEPGHAR